MPVESDEGRHGQWLLNGHDLTHAATSAELLTWVEATMARVRLPHAHGPRLGPRSRDRLQHRHRHLHNDKGQYKQDQCRALARVTQSADSRAQSAERRAQRAERRAQGAERRGHTRRCNDKRTDRSPRCVLRPAKTGFDWHRWRTGAVTTLARPGAEARPALRGQHARQRDRTESVRAKRQRKYAQHVPCLGARG